MRRGITMRENLGILGKGENNIWREWMSVWEESALGQGVVNREQQDKLEPLSSIQAIQITS
jgi:hypothetical protein